jgi:hypothetical protein
MIKTNKNYIESLNPCDTGKNNLYKKISALDKAVEFDLLIADFNDVIWFLTQSEIGKNAISDILLKYHESLQDNQYKRKVYRIMVRFNSNNNVENLFILNKNDNHFENFFKTECNNLNISLTK